jgi:hypothetical protein
MPDHFAGRAISLPQVLPTIDDVTIAPTKLHAGGSEVAEQYQKCFSWRYSQRSISSARFATAFAGAGAASPLIDDRCFV